MRYNEDGIYRMEGNVVERRLSPFMLFLICLVVSATSYAQVSSLVDPRPTQWEKTKDHEDIVIYEGDVQEDGAVPLKGHVIINHPIEKVVTVMADCQGKKRWLPAVEQVKILEQPNPYDRTEYYHVKMPLIVSDRSIVLVSKASVSEDRSEVIVKVYSNNKYKEIHSSRVRAKMPYGEVRLKSVADGKKTIVSGSFYTSPEGLVPNWIVRRFTRQFVYDSLVKLRNLVGRNLYDQQSVQKYADLIQGYGKKNRAVSSESSK